MPLPPDAPAGSDALDALREVIGVDAVVVPTGRLTAWERPARGKGGRATAVVRPADVDAVRAIVRWAREHGVRLLPQGANTGLVGASTPGDEREVVILSTDRLTEGLVIEPADRSAIVPAGMRLSALNEALAPDGLTFPIDLAADPTLGGMAATNTGGARMVRYGDVRRRVLGVEAVIADEDASVVDDLSTLRKDNTGLDLSSLFVGSSGALGIITRVAIDLAVRPRSRAAMIVIPADGDAAVRLLLAAERTTSDRLSAFEVMSAEAVGAVLSEMDDVASPFGSSGIPDLSVLVELSGPDDVDDDLRPTGRLPLGDRRPRRRHRAAGGPGVGRAAPDHRGPRADRCGRRLRRLGPPLAVEPVPDRRPGRGAAAFPRSTVADFGHWGDGGMHCNVVFPPGEPPSAIEREELRDLVFGLAVDRHGGSYSAEHGIGPHNARWWERSTPDPVKALSRSLKAVFDPLGVLGHPGLPY